MTDNLPGKILWMSNSPTANTGYGNQTRLFNPLIKNAGHDIVRLSFYGLEGCTVMAGDGIVEMSRAVDQYCNDIIEADYQFNERELLITLIDPFVCDPQKFGQTNWCAWVPVDCLPLSPENNRSLKGTRFTWSMSKFGHTQLERAGYKPYYVPHGVDTGVFKPVDRADAKKKIGNHYRLDLSDKFLVVTVAANKGTPSRKNFSGMLDTFREFAQHHPDALFYIHTDPQPTRYGDDLHTMVEAKGLKGKVIFPFAYNFMRGMYNDAYLNDLYNAADVFMLLSLGEGFGIPIIEAQASGCPVIVTDGSACSELCLSGWKVPSIPIQCYDGRAGCYWWLASTPHAVQALEDAYNAKDNALLRDTARQLAMAYDYRLVYEQYMKPAIEAMLVEVRKPQVKKSGDKVRAVSDSRSRRKANREAKKEVQVA